MGFKPTLQGWKPSVLSLNTIPACSGADGGTRIHVVNFGRVVHNFSATPACSGAVTRFETRTSVWTVVLLKLSPLIYSGSPADNRNQVKPL